MAWYHGSPVDLQQSLQNAQDALTAHSGGGQANALPLQLGMNRITVVAVAADSVVLPAALPGSVVIVANSAAANAMNVYPASGETINALAANTALSVVVNKVVIFLCFVTGKWHSILTA